MLDPSSPTAATLNDVARYYNAKFVDKRYVLCFNSGGSIETIELNFNKKNFLHLVGLEATKTAKEFAKTLRKSEYEVLFDLILINRYQEGDLKFKYSFYSSRNKIYGLRKSLDTIIKGGSIAQASNLTKSRQSIDLFIIRGKQILGIVQSDEGFAPSSVMHTDSAKRVDLHSKRTILAVQQLAKSQSISLTFVNQNITKDEATALYEILNIGESVDISNKNHRILISKAKGTEYLFSLKEQQQN